MSEPPLTLKPVPDTETDEIATSAFPVFVSFTGFDVVAPTALAPKFKLAASAVRRAFAVDPLPDKSITSGDPPPLLQIEILPVWFPDAVGLNAAVNSVSFPGARVVGIDSPEWLKPVPVAWIFVIVRSVVPVFDTRMV